MSKWIMQVHVKDADGVRREWKDVHPTNGPAYTFDTKAEAERALRMCYPDQTPDEVRVVEVSQ